jgi:hypothetical protein
VEHAFRPPATLCGIPQERVVVYRHLFGFSRARACLRCREQAAAAATQRSRERLHDKIVAAAPGPLRDQLLDALRSGAEITIWVNGPAGTVVRQYARLDRIAHGAEAVQALLTSGDRIGIAGWRPSLPASSLSSC